jgi:hypothetical protein
MNQGIYEQLVTQIVSQKLKELSSEFYYINKTKVDLTEASAIISSHLANTIKIALNYIKGEKQVERQIEIGGN